jgi:hypothetical protein
MMAQRARGVLLLCAFSVRDIRARMMARQRMADALAELRSDLPERDEDEDDLVSVRMPDPRLIFYGRPELLVFRPRALNTTKSGPF